ncbi:MAG: CBS domain-containing protein [Rhodocyclaceae bacterium]|nr:CBS domain-containing protein [Rhodocyclaceae bacterium]
MRSLSQFARQYLIAEAAPLSHSERAKSALAGLAGLLLIQGVLAVLPLDPAQRQFLLPVGATSIIMFALPHSPLGQPWSVAGGLLVSALAGLVCGHWIAWPVLAAAAAVALAIWAMSSLRCMHPPGGALAAGLALTPTASWTSLETVAANILAALAAVLLINNLLPGRRYPQCAPPAPKPAPPPPSRSGIRHQDLQYALEQIDSFIDIREDDLVRIYNLAVDHAFRRHTTQTCGDLMTKPAVAGEFNTRLDEAWTLLRENHIQALPVVDREQRVIGLLSLENFPHLTPETQTSQPEVAGQAMIHPIILAREDDNIGIAAAALATRGHQQSIPVTDADGHLKGILSQTDVLTNLYYRQASALAA